MEVTHTFFLYESEKLRKATGPAIRPGGLALTGRAMEFCKFPLQSRLLDVGCGSGATVSYLMSRFQMDACGVDISSRPSGEGKARDSALPLLRAHAEHLPFGGESLDGIICECVLSLFSEPDRVLREYHRVLAADGKLILSDIYLQGARSGEQGAGEEENLRGEPVDGCLRGASPACSVKKLLSEAGFAELLWEDHTPLLKELAARLVLAYGSMDALWGGIKDAGCSGFGLAAMAALRPGYYLLVARKE